MFKLISMIGLLIVAATWQPRLDPLPSSAGVEVPPYGKCYTLNVLPTQEDDEQRKQLIQSATKRLLEIQEPDGAWPYEGVYRVGHSQDAPQGKIPVGYRIGGTAIVCSALISASHDDQSLIEQAVTRATELILKELEDPLMEARQVRQYDVRVWGHIYALDYFCRLEMSDGFGELKEKTKPWIRRLVNALLVEEIEGGGWNYATRRSHACFVTAPALQALLLAQQQGAKVPAAVFERGAKILADSRTDDGSFQYSGIAGQRDDLLPGAIARAAVAETTMWLLGKGDQEQIQQALDAFHEHWEELEKRRQQTGTHAPPYGVAPYYFYYGHRYAAQAIRMLPSDRQDAEFEKFFTVLLKTKESDDTWNDRIFERSKAYGTAMSLLALCRESVDLPPKLEAE